MEVKRICQWCGKPFIAQKTTTCYCSPQCSKRGYKHRIKERKMELRHIQEMQELRSSLEKQEYFTFSQAARLMGVSRQYIYKLVKEDKLRASRISGRMALVRRADSLTAAGRSFSSFYGALIIVEDHLFELKGGFYFGFFRVIFADEICYIRLMLRSKLHSCIGASATYISPEFVKAI